MRIFKSLLKYIAINKTSAVKFIPIWILFFFFIFMTPSLSPSSLLDFVLNNTRKTKCPKLIRLSFIFQLILFFIWSCIFISFGRRIQCSITIKCMCLYYALIECSSSNISSQLNEPEKLGFDVTSSAWKVSEKTRQNQNMNLWKKKLPTKINGKKHVYIVCRTYSVGTMGWNWALTHTHTILFLRRFHSQNSKWRGKKLSYTIHKHMHAIWKKEQWKFFWNIR